MMVCRAGRECKVGADGEAACACLATCPDHFVPVCGSNNQSYDNFCLMHRDACLTGVHISLKKKGYCSNKSIKKKSSKKDKLKDENHFEPGKFYSIFILFVMDKIFKCCVVLLGGKSSGVFPMGKGCSTSPNHQLLPASYRRPELVPTRLEELRKAVCPFLHVRYHQRQLCRCQRISRLRD